MVGVFLGGVPKIETEIQLINRSLSVNWGWILIQ